MINKLLKYVLFCVLSQAICSYGASLLSVTERYNSADKQVIDLVFSDKSVLPKSFVNGGDLKLDFDNINNTTNQDKFHFTDGLIQDIHLISNTDKLRLSFVNLANNAYFMNIESNTLSITFVRSKTSGQVSPQNAKLLKQSKTNINNKLLSYDYKIDDLGGSVITLTFSNNKIGNFTDTRLDNSLLVDIGNFILESNLAKTYDVSDFNSKVKSFQLTNKNKGIHLTVNNRDQWKYFLYQIENKLIINISPNTNTSNNNSDAIPSLKPNQSNLVSFNFQNIDVRALLQLLSEFSGYNILISDQVTGSISIKLDNVPWDDALNIILDTKGLGYQRISNVIKVAPLSEIMATSKQELEKQKLQISIEPLDMLTLHLKYTKVKEMQQMLQAPFGKDKDNSDNSLLSKRGSILADDRTNTMIINDTPSHLKMINGFISKIDIPVQQVMIEARIVEASSNFEKALGTQMFIAGLTSQTSYANNLSNAVGVQQNGAGSIFNNAAGGANKFQNTTSAINGSSFAMVFSPNGNNLLGLELDANEAMNDGRTISNPKVITSNYKLANIQQGIQIPYQSSTSSGATSVSFISATLSLKVTPQITEDGNIILDVDVHKDTVNSSLQVQGTPSINTNSITTNVLVQDGSTIMIGGVYVDTVSKIQQQVPFLGDIPVLGWLFKSVQNIKNKQELLIFITPRIIKNVNSIDE